MPTLADALRQTGYSQDGTLAAPVTDSPMTKALSEHIKGLPQQFNKNQADQMALLNQAFPGNTYESMMTQGDPKAMAELAMQVPLAGMVAYHGTPHNILGKFDISKVGTGEGAQAYGHGMYFAENPSVAKEYQKLDPAGGPTLPTRRLLNGVELEPGTPEYHAGTLLSRNGVTLKSAKDMVKSWIDDPSALSAGEKTVEGWKKTLETLNSIPKKSAFKELPHEGNLYKVDIPDEHIPNMLDWDKPLSQQSKVVQDALAKIDKDLYHPSGSDYDPEELGQMVYSRLKSIRSAKGDVEADKAASEMLNSIGIKGIRYLDEGSRDAKKGTSNFVVFDPSEVKILEKNSQPVSRKELIEEQINKLK